MQNKTNSFLYILSLKRISVTQQKQKGVELRENKFFVMPISQPRLSFSLDQDNFFNGPPCNIWQDLWFLYWWKFNILLINRFINEEMHY